MIVVASCPTPGITAVPVCIGIPAVKPGCFSYIVQLRVAPVLALV